MILKDNVRQISETTSTDVIEVEDRKVFGEVFM